MNSGYKIPVLDKGHVIYLRHLGDDMSIVEAARVSYKSASKGADADKKLLGYLYKNKHMSPFEQVNISFIIKMPIFVMRQFVRHRTFRLNEMSARYTEMWDDFYVPTQWRIQDLKNKQGSLDAGMDEAWQYRWTKETEILYKHAFNLYKSMLEAGIAKEMARLVLPVSNYTEIQVNCDLRNLMHFLGLRLDSHAQYEIRVFAEAMRDIAKELYPWTLGAFERYKNVVVDLEEDVPAGAGAHS
jgi:thymidylate synthase (FAD)